MLKVYKLNEPDCKDNELFFQTADKITKNRQVWFNKINNICINFLFKFNKLSGVFYHEKAKILAENEDKLDLIMLNIRWTQYFLTSW